METLIKLINIWQLMQCTGLYWGGRTAGHSAFRPQAWV